MWGVVGDPGFVWTERVRVGRESGIPINGKRGGLDEPGLRVYRRRKVGKSKDEESFRKER